MGGDILLIVAVFAVVTSFILLVALLVSRPDAAVDTRVTNVASPGRSAVPTGHAAKGSTLPKMGALIMPEDESRASRLTARLRQAGLYRRHSTAVYLGVKFVLMVVPMMVGLGLSSIGLVGLSNGLVFGAAIGLAGNLAPSAWLIQLKKKRQKNIRRALPDALDIIVVCLEGGLSLSGSFAHVASELKEAHPLLADEMSIVRREVQLGRTTGQALRQFADRFDLEELRSLASVVIQAERFGASVNKALRVHADALRVKRYQHAETQAQEAIKLIFPTVLCIFPALYIVLMGPAGVQLLEMLNSFEK